MRPTILVTFKDLRFFCQNKIIYEYSVSPIVEMNLTSFIYQQELILVNCIFKTALRYHLLQNYETVTTVVFADQLEPTLNCYSIGIGLFFL